MSGRFECPPEHRHAETGTCYQEHKCRCDPCRLTQNARARAWKHRALGQTGLVDGTPTRRRIEALRARGWTLAELSRLMGRSEGYLHRILSRPKRTVRLHNEVAALYERLWDQTPPTPATQHEKSMRARTARLARDRGFVPPMGWDDIEHDPEPPAVEPVEGEAFDHAAVELAVAGQKVPLTTQERQEAVRRMYPWKWSDARMGRHLGCAGETVLRDRREMGLPAWPSVELDWAERAA